MSLALWEPASQKVWCSLESGVNQLHYFLALGPWAADFASLSLGFLITEKQIIVVRAS